MTPPVEPAGEQDARAERGADHEQRARRLQVPRQHGVVVPRASSGANAVNIYAPDMQIEVLGKPTRQRLIPSLIARKRIGTQFELLDALADAGCRVTQATVSRDIRELGLVKTLDPLGRPRYVLPERRTAVDPRELLDSILGQFGHRVSVAQNLVVLQSELGSAPAIARALDRVDHPLVVGTLAGDDTVLVIARSGSDARALAAELAE
jgi:transcriptional regulator of arginine metabolism